MAAAPDRGVPLSTLCPKFLHTNSTSHTWPFSAIAELIDNAYDPDVSAKQFWIDRTIVKGQECLTFMDNGNGLDPETMHKMLSFGYSDKVAVDGVEPIGIYGNGFKSGSMRLGKDAIVFSKSKGTSCVGMLSQTYLEEVAANQIIVPIICFEQGDKRPLSVRDEHKASLQDILRYSPFNTLEEIDTELNAIQKPFCTKNIGTRIIIWNLRGTTDNKVEFDFDKDRYDIRIPSEVYEAMNDTNQPDRVTSYTPESVYSLRAYCSILYLKPRMQVIIRGQKVKSQLVAKSLAYIKKDQYKPTFLNKRVPITFGYNTKSKDQYGIMMYHKNRLIKAYERVGCQLKANNQGVGVIGVVECNYLDPTHNKQNFLETDKYRKTMTNLAIKLEEYWKEIRHRRNKANPTNLTPVEDTMKRPDQNWVQCDECLRWRKLPDGIEVSKLPEKWFCYMNPDHQFRSCHAEEEAEDSDDDQPYQKTYKLQERENKKQQEKKRQKNEEELRRQEEQRMADLTKQNEALRRKQEKLRKQLLQTTLQSPSSPTTPRSRVNTESLQGGAERPESSPLRSTISQAACSPSSSNGLPVITNVCSLSAEHPRGKRLQPFNPQTTPKRPRVNSFHRSISDTPSSVNGSPHCSPSLLDDVNHDTDDTDVTDDTDISDDDIVILETVSTPKPKKPKFDLTKVKTELNPNNADVSMLLECSDDAAVDADLVTNAAGGSTGSPAVGSSPLPSPSTDLVSATTQTEGPKVKQENNQSQIEKIAGQSTSSEDDQSENKEKSHDPDATAGPSCAEIISPPHLPSLTEVQEQQDLLLELMQTTAQERDSFKEQVHGLTRQLQDTESRLQELSQIRVKQECSDQERVGTDGAEYYKSLFEKTKQKVDELIQDKEALLAAAETKPSTDPVNEKDIDEFALQADCLLRELDQRTKENDDLQSQVDRLEEERASLASQCEELRFSLQQQRENERKGNTTPQRNTDASVQTDPEEARGTAGSGTDSSSDTSRSLIELRQNVGRLLVNYVPALDLDQVNYECNVIDEILEQVVQEQLQSVSTARQRDEAARSDE